MPKIYIQNKEINYGSLMEIEDRFGFFDQFNKKDSDQYLELKNFISLTQDKKILFDVGSSYGVFSLVFCDSINKKSFAFDAAPEAYLSLQQTKNLNKEKNIEIFRCLIGDKYAFIGTVYDKHQAIINERAKTFEIIIPIDLFCNIYNQIPDVIKIDVEGFELRVLQGAKQVILNYKPDIFLEIHRTFLLYYNDSVEKLISFLNEIEYCIYDLNLNFVNDPKSFLENQNSESVRIILLNKSKCNKLHL